MNSINIVGFGNQAKSWCENLRDSGHKFTLTLRNGASATQAQALGFPVFDLNQHQFDQECCRWPFALLAPDNQHQHIIQTIKKNNPRPLTFLLAHGHSYEYAKIKSFFPDDHFILFSLKSIGKEVRNQYLARESIASVYSLEDFTNSTERETWMKYLAQLALALGSHTPPFSVTMKEETDADLLSEQTLLCGFYPYMIEKVFKYMVSKGISQELAYYECFEESFLILKALRDLGPEHFFNMISPNALIGSYDAHINLPHKELDAFIDNQWNKIQSGHFQKYCEGNTAFEDMKTKTMQHWQSSQLAQTFNKIKGHSI